MLKFERCCVFNVRRIPIFDEWAAERKSHLHVYLHLLTVAIPTRGPSWPALEVH